MITPEQLLELIKSRRSIRRFADRAVSREDLDALLEAARWAPSNHNRQPWKFLVLQNRHRIRALAGVARRELAVKLKSLPESAAAHTGDLMHYATFFEAAPVLLVVLHKHPVAVASALWEGVRHPHLVSGEPLSVAMAVQNLLLAAHARGLGACVLTAPLVAYQAVVEHLNIPPGFDITCFVAVGFPGESPPPPRRKNIEQIIEFGDSAGQADEA